MTLTASDPTIVSMTASERLIEHVLCEHTLTPLQLTAHWSFRYQRAQWVDKAGKTHDGATACIGVVVPPDGAAPEIRVRADEAMCVRGDGASENFATFANRRMLDYLTSRGAATPSSLATMITVKNKLVETFKLIHSEDPVTGEEFKAALLREWDKVWVESKPEER